ncbi:MAG: ABC transporter ATP-binding protein [Halanaeroarchaeum sp.]
MGGPPAPTVAVEDLGREFGDQTALDGVDLTFAGPNVIGVAGPNGAGKTTLIRILLGLLAPTDGVARVFGTDTRDLGRAERERIGYMPQHRAVYDDLSVRDNVDFFASLYDVADREAAVDRALDLVDLRHRAGDPVASLSGGLIRRTSLAGAVVHDPDLLVLDEPTVGLDPELRATMWETFREMREAGTLILVSTHYLGEARHCDRVLFLREGRVLDLDTPEQFLERTDTTDLDDAFLALLHADGEQGDGPEATG